MNRTAHLAAAPALLAAFLASAAAAEEPKEPRRTRVGLGAQLVPSYPGSDSVSVRPLIDVSRTRGSKPFEFEAADESFGFALVRGGGFAAGPALNLEGSRTAGDVGTPLPKVGFTVEAGAFAEYTFPSERLRLRAEVRKGLGGHEGVIGTVGADFVARRKDDWLFSIGPRLTFADRRYQTAYFGVAPADSAPSGLPAYSADAGLLSAGATAGYLMQLSRRWGIYSYAKYDRLVGDAAASPIVTTLGSRNQLSGGLALTYTFGGK